jgi:hypothetical protein
VAERVTLVRGRVAQNAARIVAGDHPLTRYSQNGRGWCIPTEHVDDLLAYAEFRHWLVIVTDKRKGVTP